MSLNFPRKRHLKSVLLLLLLLLICIIIIITDQITENNLQEMAAWLFSAVFVKVKKQRALNTD